MSNLFLSLLIASALVGCAGTPEDPRVVAFDAGKRQVELDKRVLYECPDLPKLTGATDLEFIAALKQWSAQYKECRGWKTRLNKVAREAFNIKE